MHILEQFIHWIHVCLSTAAFSISVLNGELEGFFPSARGLRQGCTLSPYLFVIAINVLSLALNKSSAAGNIGYHPTCAQINLTQLSFADDIMVFTDGEPSSLQGIFSVLNEFESWSGLAIIPAKSAIYMGGTVHQCFLDEVSRLNLPIDTLPIRYLGLPSRPST